MGECQIQGYRLHGVRINITPLTDIIAVHPVHPWHSPMEYIPNRTCGLQCQDQEGKHEFAA